MFTRILAGAVQHENTIRVLEIDWRVNNCLLIPNQQQQLFTAALICKFYFKKHWHQIDYRCLVWSLIIASNLTKKLEK
jgi:hypothetical protein